MDRRPAKYRRYKAFFAMDKDPLRGSDLLIDAAIAF